MTILKSITQEELANINFERSVISEAIYGDNATVFHRTDVKDLVRRVYDSGFKAGDGEVYGKGFYATYDIESQMDSEMPDVYGHIIVKFSCPLTNFFIFDWDVFQKVELCKKLKANKDNFIHLQCKHFKINILDVFDSEDEMTEFIQKAGRNTSKILDMFLSNVPDFTRVVKGAVFTENYSGGGKFLVSYDISRVVPLSFTQDEGKTWIKADMGIEYIKKALKGRLNPVLPFKFRTIEEYADTLKRDITKYVEVVNGKINVNASITLQREHIINGRFPYPFGKIVGNFICKDLKLRTLENAPVEVGGDFDARNNLFKTLEGAPKKVGNDFLCSRLWGNKFTKEDVLAVCEVGGTIRNYIEL